MTMIHLRKKDIVKSKVRGVEIEFDHEKLATILGIPGNNGIREYVKDVWEESKYIKPLEITRSGENRRRDDDEATPEEEAEGEDEGNRDAQGSPNRSMRFQQMLHPPRFKQKDKGIAGVDPSGPTSREADLLKFQAEFERKRANKFHDELEKAKAENAKLLALLHQAQTKPHP
ncbi:hypothetical protein Dimus_000811 [Dionaea muscipula]